MDDFFERDYYQTLGVERNASSAEIESAYRKTRKAEHPDRPDRRDDPRANDRFRRVNDAYETLIDAQSRRDYDDQLTQQSPVSQPSASEAPARQQTSPAQSGPSGTGTGSAGTPRAREPQAASQGQRRRRDRPREMASERADREAGESRGTESTAQRTPTAQSSGARAPAATIPSWPGTVGAQQAGSGTGAEESSADQAQTESEDRDTTASGHAQERQREQPERTAVDDVRRGLRVAALLLATAAVAMGIGGSLASVAPLWGGALPFTIFPAIAMLGGILLVATLPISNTRIFGMLIVGAMLAYLLTTRYFDELYGIYSFGSRWNDDSTGLRSLLVFPAIVIDGQLDASAHQYGAIPAICAGIIVSCFWRIGMQRQAADQTGSQNPVVRQRLLPLAEVRNTALASFGWGILTAPVSYAVLQTLAFLLFLIIIGLPFLVIDIFADLTFGPILDGDAWNLWIVMVAGLAAFACGMASGAVPSLLDQLVRRIARKENRTRDWLANGSLLLIALAPSILLFALITLGGLYWEPLIEPLIEWAYS